ncbi:LytTR family DNA-binding domain-containing protein [Enterococcus sp. LJL99]
MKVTIQIVEPQEEEKIDLYVHQMDEQLIKMITAVQKKEETLLGSIGEKIFRVEQTDVLYFETVDKKTFMYLKESVYEMKERLYQLEERFEHSDFLRVSKSVIVNIRKIQVIYPTLSGRFEVVLENGEKLSISRNYVADLKRKLKMEGA